jgi:hypothetical protein
VQLESTRVAETMGRANEVAGAKSFRQCAAAAAGGACTCSGRETCSTRDTVQVIVDTPLESGSTSARDSAREAVGQVCVQCSFLHVLFLFPPAFRWHSLA